MTAKKHIHQVEKQGTPGALTILDDWTTTRTTSRGIGGAGREIKIKADQILVRLGWGAYPSVLGGVSAE